MDAIKPPAQPDDFQLPQAQANQAQRGPTSQPATKTAEDPTISAAAEEAKASNAAETADSLSQGSAREASQSTDGCVPPVVRLPAARDVVQCDERGYTRQAAIKAVEDAAIKAAAAQAETSNAAETMSADPPPTEDAANRKAKEATDREDAAQITVIEAATIQAMATAIRTTSRETAAAAQDSVPCQPSTAISMRLAFGISSSRLRQQSSHLKFFLQVEKALKITKSSLWSCCRYPPSSQWQALAMSGVLISFRKGLSIVHCSSL